MNCYINEYILKKESYSFGVISSLEMPYNINI